MSNATGQVVNLAKSQATLSDFAKNFASRDKLCALLYILVHTHTRPGTYTHVRAQIT